MKKAFSILIAAALLLALAVVPASASGKPRFYLTGPSSANVGDQIKVSLNIEGNYQANIFNLKVNFDPGALRYVSNTFGSASPTGAMVLCDLTTDGKAVSYGAMLASGSTSNVGQLVEITFEVRSTASNSTSLSITVEEFKYLDMNSAQATPISCDTAGLTISISGGNPPAPTPVPQPGTHTPVPPQQTREPSGTTPDPYQTANTPEPARTVDPGVTTEPGGSAEPATTAPDPGKVKETQDPNTTEPIDPSEPAVSETPGASPEGENSGDNGGNGSGALIFIIVIGALVALLGAVIAVFAVRSAKEKKEDK